jgi:hypothetical protein
MHGQIGLPSVAVAHQRCRLTALEYNPEHIMYNNRSPVDKLDIRRILMRCRLGIAMKIYCAVNGLS